MVADHPSWLRQAMENKMHIWVFINFLQINQLYSWMPMPMPMPKLRPTQDDNMKVKGNEDLILVHDAFEYGDCHLSLAIPKYGIFENINSLKELAQMPQWTPERPLRVATGFTCLAPEFMKDNGLKHVTFSTADGALEAAPVAKARQWLLQRSSRLQEKELCNQDQDVVEGFGEDLDESIHPARATKMVLHLLPVSIMLLMFALIFQQPATFFTKQGMAMRRNIGTSFRYIHSCWYMYEEEEVVAEGKIASTDPSARVHHLPIGRDCWKVWVEEVYMGHLTLYRPTAEHRTLSDAIGSTVVWPKSSIRLSL